MFYLEYFDFHKIKASNDHFIQRFLPMQPLSSLACVQQVWSIIHPNFTHWWKSNNWKDRKKKKESINKGTRTQWCGPLCCWWTDRISWVWSCNCRWLMTMESSAVDSVCWRTHIKKIITCLISSVISLCIVHYSSIPLDSSIRRWMYKCVPGHIWEDRLLSWHPLTHCNFIKYHKYFCSFSVCHLHWFIHGHQHSFSTDHHILIFFCFQIGWNLIL